MNKLAEPGLSDDAIITDGKKRYASGVLKYKQMGYWHARLHAKRHRH